MKQQESDQNLRKVFLSFFKPETIHLLNAVDEIGIETLLKDGVDFINRNISLEYNYEIFTKICKIYADHRDITTI